MIGVTEYEINRSRQAEVHELAARSALQMASDVDRILFGVQAVLAAIAQVPAVNQLNREACTSYLRAVGPNQPNLVAITVIDAEGRFRCGSGDDPGQEASFVDRSYFGAALAAAGPVVGTFTTGKVSGRGLLPVATALRDAAGKPIGVLLAALDLAWLGEQLKQRGLPPDGSFTVADRNGVILAREPFPDRFVGTSIPKVFARLVNASASGAEAVVSQDGTPRVLGYVPVSGPPTGLYVSVGLSAEVSYRAVNRAAIWGAVLAACAGLATLAATWVVGSSVFIRPIAQLTRVSQRWRHGDRAARTGFHGDADEIGALGEALDRMMDEIAAHEQQRELLAGELAHRIKNTLATVQAIAARTLDKPTAGEDLLPDFQSRIAALARTHEVLMRDRWEGAQLGDIALRVLQPLLGDTAGIVSLDGPPVELPPREALGMTMVLHELATNALKYGALTTPAGRLRLVWSAAAARGGQSVDLTWQELGGPPVVRIGEKAGFGSRLLARALGSAGSATLAFDPAGVVCRIKLVLRPDGAGGDTDIGAAALPAAE